ncbi:hypothetical protein [Kordiimonas laminariae]|uniref:hypothetical protein n=1 Tax=Kordiimonas laminariae TaxID=2917717 RepID=UPI001FF5EA61|nr:hypothetical protein [Kordiimonas laminariae]MCK0068055.1 hypothetical protein [Kordiimonas laminariae]
MNTLSILLMATSGFLNSETAEPIENAPFVFYLSEKNLSAVTKSKLGVHGAPSVYLDKDTEFSVCSVSSGTDIIPLERFLEFSYESKKQVPVAGVCQQFMPGRRMLSLSPSSEFNARKAAGVKLSFTPKNYEINILHLSVFSKDKEPIRFEVKDNVSVSVGEAGHTIEYVGPKPRWKPDVGCRVVVKHEPGRPSKSVSCSNLRPGHYELYYNGPRENVIAEVNVMVSFEKFDPNLQTRPESELD